ncbi:MAG: nuclear transport factor 2 family protein [Candidatus Bathyarchaeia archaeon]
MKEGLMLSHMELQKIREAVDIYLLAIKTGDYKFFKRAFYPDAVVIYAGENDLEKKVTPIKVFADRIKERHESGTDSEEIPLEVTTSYVGGVANVRLDFKLKIGEKTLYGTDYLNLVKHDNQWKISQKIYDVTRTE